MLYNMQYIHPFRDWQPRKPAVSGSVSCSRTLLRAGVLFFAQAVTPPILGHCRRLRSVLTNDFSWLATICNNLQHYPQTVLTCIGPIQTTASYSTATGCKSWLAVLQLIGVDWGFYRGSSRSGYRSAMVHVVKYALMRKPQPGLRRLPEFLCGVNRSSFSAVNSDVCVGYVHKIVSASLVSGAREIKKIKWKVWENYLLKPSVVGQRWWVN